MNMFSGEHKWLNQHEVKFIGLISVEILRVGDIKLTITFAEI